MGMATRRSMAGLMAAGLIIAAAAPAAAQEADWPDSGPLNDGSTFELNQRIKDKLAAGEEINYVFSYQSPTIPLFSDQYKAGYETTLPQAQEILPTMVGDIIAPVSDTGIDVPGQIAQIEALSSTPTPSTACRSSRRTPTPSPRSPTRSSPRASRCSPSA